MSAITTCFEALSLTTSDAVFYHRDCYFVTAEYMGILAKRGVDVRPVDMASSTEVRDLITYRPSGKKVVFAETFNNHCRMIRAPIETLAIDMSGGDCLVIDNSLISASQLAPGVFWESRCDIVYIESLTKYYHVDESSRVSAGIALFPSRTVLGNP